MGKSVEDAVVRKSLNSGCTSAFLRSSISFSRVDIHDVYKCVFWNSSQVPSSENFLNIASACLPCPWPSDNCLRSLPIFLSENFFKSASGSDPGVMTKIIGVSLMELAYPSSILNRGGSMKCLSIFFLMKSLMQFVI